MQLLILFLLAAPADAPPVVPPLGPEPAGPRAAVPPLRPSTAMWVPLVGLEAAAAAERGSAQRTPSANPRYAPPGREPLVGYAPQVGGPLPGYPGVPYSAAGDPGYPSRLAGTGPLASLYVDLKASQPGDVITIVITTQAVAAANAAKTSGQTADVGFDGGAGLFSILPGFSLGYEGSQNGSTNDTSDFQVSTTFTVVVRDVAPNGNLLVEGEQVVNLDGRPQWVKLSGEVRPYDVTRDNTVPSTKVANVNIEFQGTRSRANRPGFFERVAHAIEGLFGIFF